MKRVLRIGLAIVLGLALAIGIVAAIDSIGNLLFPVSLDIDVADRETLSRVIAGMPWPAKLLVILPWFLAPLCGAWLALRVCDWRWAGWIVMIALLAVTIANLAALPHPLWMQVCGVALPLLGGGAAQRLHRKPYRGEPLFG